MTFKMNSKFFFTTHLHCHSLLQGKALSLSKLAARVRIQWLSREHKPCQRHTGHSSSWKQMETAQCHHWHRHSGNPGLQQVWNRGGQVLEAEEDILILVEGWKWNHININYIKHIYIKRMPDSIADCEVILYCWTRLKGKSPIGIRGEQITWYSNILIYSNLGQILFIFVFVQSDWILQSVPTPFQIVKWWLLL